MCPYEALVTMKNPSDFLVYISLDAKKTINRRDAVSFYPFAWLDNQNLNVSFDGISKKRALRLKRESKMNFLLKLSLLFVLNTPNFFGVRGWLFLHYY